MPTIKLDITKNDAFEELDRLSQDLPAIIPYTAAKLAGYINIKKAVPGILDGELKGFQPRTGRTKSDGLKAIFKNQRGGFAVRLWTPLFNIFVPGTKRGIAPVPLIDTLQREVESSLIIQDTVDEILQDFQENKISKSDIDKYATYGIRRRRR